MTEKHQLLTDKQLELQFKNCTIPPILVTTEAHLRLAYIHVKKYGLKKATINLFQQFTEFNKNYGNIITFSKSSISSLVKLIYDFIKKATTSSFRNLMIEFPSIKKQFLEIIDIKQEITSDVELLSKQKNSSSFSIL